MTSINNQPYIIDQQPSSLEEAFNYNNRDVLKNILHLFSKPKVPEANFMNTERFLMRKILEEKQFYEILLRRLGGDSSNGNFEIDFRECINTDHKILPLLLYQGSPSEENVFHQLIKHYKNLKDKNNDKIFSMLREKVSPDTVIINICGSGERKTSFVTRLDYENKGKKSLIKDMKCILFEHFDDSGEFYKLFKRTMMFSLSIFIIILPTDFDELKKWIDYTLNNLPLNARVLFVDVQTEGTPTLDLKEFSDWIEDYKEVERLRGNDFLLGKFISGNLDITYEGFLPVPVLNVNDLTENFCSVFIGVVDNMRKDKILTPELCMNFASNIQELRKKEKIWIKKETLKESVFQLYDSDDSFSDSVLTGLIEYAERIGEIILNPDPKSKWYCCILYNDVHNIFGDTDRSSYFWNEEKKCEFCAGRLVSFYPIRYDDEFGKIFPPSIHFFERFQMQLARVFGQSIRFTLVPGRFSVTLVYNWEGLKASILAELGVNSNQSLKTCRFWLASSSLLAIEHLLASTISNNNPQGAAVGERGTDFDVIDRVLDQFIDWLKSACLIDDACPNLYSYCIHPDAVGLKHEDTLKSFNTPFYYFGLEETKTELKKKVTNKTLRERLYGKESGDLSLLDDLKKRTLQSASDVNQITKDLESQSLPRLCVIFRSKFEWNYILNPIRWLITSHYKLFFVCPITAFPSETNNGNGIDFYIPFQWITLNKSKIDGVLNSEIILLVDLISNLKKKFKKLFQTQVNLKYPLMTSKFPI